jgi:hypothetical protein
MKGRLAWLHLLGLLIGGWAAAHGLAYRVVVPDSTERSHLLEETGHGYLDAAPLLSLVLTLIALGFVGSLVRGRARFCTPWPFALLPPGAFIVQEHVERLLHEGQLPVTAALGPTFMVGLLLQLPFALAALLLARGMVALAEALVHRRGSEHRGVVEPPPGLCRPASFAPFPRTGLLALGHGQRAPPAFLLR